MKNDATGQDLLREIGEETLRLLELGWTQGVAARDINGMSVSATAESACAWCLHGAVTRATYNVDTRRFPARVSRLRWVPSEEVRVQSSEFSRRIYPESSLGAGVGTWPWNDAPERTKEEVVALVRDVVEGLKQ